MKNILKISIAVLASSTLFTGCIKETFPTSGATADQVTTESLMNGLYYQMTAVGNTGAGSNGFQWDFGLPAVHIVFDAMCEDMTVLGNPGYDWFAAWPQNQYLGDRYYQCIVGWYNYYPWIKTCNDVLGRIDPATEIEAEKIMRGKVLAFRAYFYLDLVRMYEFKENKYTDGQKVLGLGVPIVTEKTTEEMSKNNPRASVEDCYEFILDNLKQAEACLTGYKANAKTEPDLSVVFGLYARTYLAMTELDDRYYALAADYARKAINASGCTPLTQEQWESPTTGFNSMTANNSWMLGLGLPSENVSNLLNFTAHMSAEGSWGYGEALGRGISKRLFDQIPDTDFRKHSWVDPTSGYEYKSNRWDDVAEQFKSMPLVCIKFRPAQGEFTNYKIGGAAEHPLMRVEEMYLIEAEAAGKANLSTGIQLLNDFMKYRITDKTKPYNCNSKVTNFRELQEEVILQKRIEFWGEGIVFFDYKRLRLGVTRGYAGTNITGDYLMNCDEIAPWWNWVIPRSESQSNAAVNGYNNPDPMGSVDPWEA